MRKIQLNLDDLKVQSFVTTPQPNSDTGTVFGYGSVDVVTCVANPTCEIQCTGTGGEGTGGPIPDPTCGPPGVDTCTCGVTGDPCTTGDATQDYTCNGTCSDAEGCTACGMLC